MSNEQKSLVVRIVNRGIILSLLFANNLHQMIISTHVNHHIIPGLFPKPGKKAGYPPRAVFHVTKSTAPPKNNHLPTQPTLFAKTAKKPCEFPRTVSGFIPADLSPRVPTSTGSVKALQAYERHWSCGKALAELQKVLQSMLRSRPRKAGH